jgi:hypothetical protein
MALVIVVLLAIGGAAYLSKHPRRPGADELLGTDYLDQWKLICEGQARDVKVLGRKAGAVAKYKGSNTQALYADAKAEVESYIAFLCDGLTRRFNQPGDTTEIQRRLLLVEEKVRAFSTYASHTLQQETPAIEPFNAELMRQQHDDLVKAFRSVGDKDMDDLRDHLQRFRFRGWSELAVN